MKNKIGWCNTTWNPVWGCRNHCEYCYARKIAKRFWKKTLEKEFYYYYYDGRTDTKWTGLNDEYKGLDKFKPVFLKSQFNKKFPKKPQRIFVGSMSEIAHWKSEWIEMVIEKVKQYPQHTFMFLSKDSYTYHNHCFYYFPQNCWLGVTITREKDLRNISHRFIYSNNNITYLSIEPILEYIKPSLINTLNINWVIIGAETGNRKNKVIPKLDWVLEIVRYCEHHNISVYIKDNIVKYYSEFGGYKQFPQKRG